MIKKDDRKAHEAAAQKWADKNGHTITRIHPGDDLEPEAYIIENDSHGIELRPEDGWAYVHGRGLLNGLSTNISSMGELDAGVKRLKKLKAAEIRRAADALEEQVNALESQIEALGE